MDSKINMVAGHLEHYGCITSWEAISRYRATRLAAIIFILKERGYDIEAERVNEYDELGKYKGHHTVYTLMR